MKHNISTKREEKMKQFNERRAEFVYEGARIHALALQCPIVPKQWDEREDDFRTQFVTLISDLCEGKRDFADFKEAHDSWMKKYFEMGWVWGKDYDPKRYIQT